MRCKPIIRKLLDDASNDDKLIRDANLFENSARRANGVNSSWNNDNPLSGFETAGFDDRSDREATEKSDVSSAEEAPTTRGRRQCGKLTEGLPKTATSFAPNTSQFKIRKSLQRVSQCGFKDKSRKNRKVNMEQSAFRVRDLKTKSVKPLLPKGSVAPLFATGGRRQCGKLIEGPPKTATDFAPNTNPCKIRKSLQRVSQRGFKDKSGKKRKVDMEQSAFRVRDVKTKSVKPLLPKGSVAPLLATRGRRQCRKLIEGPPKTATGFAPNTSPFKIRKSLQRVSQCAFKDRSRKNRQVNMEQSAFRVRDLKTKAVKPLLPKGSVAPLLERELAQTMEEEISHEDTLPAGYDNKIAKCDHFPFCTARIHLMRWLRISAEEMRDRAEVTFRSGRQCLRVDVRDLLWNGANLPSCEHGGTCATHGEMRVHGTSQIENFISSGGRFNACRRSKDGKIGWYHCSITEVDIALQYAYPFRVDASESEYWYRAVVAVYCYCYNSCGAENWKYTKLECGRYYIDSLLLFPCSACRDIAVIHPDS